MRHSEAEEMLARRPELTVREEARLQQHLDGCPACRELSWSYERQGMLIRAAATATPPPALRGAVLAQMRQSQPRWKPAIPRPPVGRPSIRRPSVSRLSIPQLSVSRLSVPWPSFRPAFAIAPLGVCAATVLAALIYRHQLAPSTTTPAAFTGGLQTSVHPSARPAHDKKVHAASTPRLPSRHHGHPTGHSNGTKSGSTKPDGAVALGVIPSTTPPPTASIYSVPTLVPATAEPGSGQPLISAAPPPTAAPTTASQSQPPSNGGTRAGGSGQKPSSPPVAPPQPAASPVVPTVVVVYRSTATPVPVATVPQPIITYPRVSPTPVP